MRYSVPFLFVQITVLVLVTGPLAAQAQPPRIDPFSPDVGRFTKVGEMNGSGFDGTVKPMGDCDGDKLNDWIVHRVREDTLVDHFGNPKKPIEMFLYRGVRGSLPNIEVGARIGLTEIGVRHQFLAAGDWDKDGNIDIAMRTMKLNDSIYGTRAADQFDLVIFWGNVEGQYSLGDTTHLMSRGDAWISLCDGLSEDIDQDGIDDLLVRGCNYEGGIARLIGGGSIPAPSMSIFRGKENQRWGRSETDNHADWEWWHQPIFNRMGEKLVDQNCDDAPDIVLYHDEALVNHISILYGTPGGGLPDTNNVETLDLSKPWPPAETAQLMDVTGDHVLDLVVLDDMTQIPIDSQHIRIYPGEPGLRLTELYGDGTTPWANFPTPGALHDGWGGLRERLYDLGSANPAFRPGNRDIYAYHHPFLVSYTTGVVLDSLIDGYYRFDGLAPQTFVDLGNIDGSDRSTIAVGYGSLDHGSGVIYLKGSDSIVGYGNGHQLPHPPGIRCSSTVSVASDERDMSREGLSLRVFPNPSNGTVQIAWDAVQGEEGDLRVSDALGRGILQINIGAGITEAVWNAAEVPAGIYFITVTIGEQNRTTQIHIL